MSCLGPLYNPSIPKEWTRFENRCVYQQPLAVADINTQVYIPLLQKTVPIGSVQYELAMLSKGNVLQYKKNSSNITKAQKYAQIAQGMWTNRNTTWASQTQTVTSPNTKSLRRVNYTNSVIVNGIAVPTIDPITCPSPIIPVYPVLPNSGGNEPNPIPPPVLPPTPQPSGPSGPIIPPIIIIPIPPPIVIPNGGSLVCNVIENICTGEIYSITVDQKCYPTSDSDVPGPIINLCYNNSLPTYYPKTKLTYGTSGNKWPINNKIWGSANGIVSDHNISSTLSDILHTSPLIQLTSPLNVIAIGSDGQVMLSWTPPMYTGNNTITNYIIKTYNGSSINLVNLFSTNTSLTTSTTILGLTNNNLYTFIVAAVTSALTGPISKLVSATPKAISIVTPITVPNAPINLYTRINDSIVVLNWSSPSYNGGSPIIKYYVTTSTGTITYPYILTDTTATITGLTNGTLYTFTVAAINIKGTGASMSISATPNIPTPVPANIGSSEIRLTWANLNQLLTKKCR